MRATIGVEKVAIHACAYIVDWQLPDRRAELESADSGAPMNPAPAHLPDTDLLRADALADAAAAAEQACR